MRTSAKILTLVLALLALGSCTRDLVDLEEADRKQFGEYGYTGQYQSMNSAFEKDWASQKEISLVTSYRIIGGQEVVESIKVPLPWAYDEGPQQWLPQYTARNMAEIDRENWKLVFNLTGIDKKPGEHYFGLYNPSTGILRVFYYLTEDRIPAHDGNDHMWSMGFTKDLLEHVCFQYAIPYGEEITDEYKMALGGDDAVYKTTALTSACSDQGKVVPAIGWWAYDINMAPMRKHDFFSSDRSVMTPGMMVFNEDNVVLNSLMEGSLDGTFSGNMNLKSLKGTGTSTGGIIAGVLGSSFSSFLTNTKVLECLTGDHFNWGGTCWTALIGMVLGGVGKGLESGLKTGVEDKDKLGDFNGSINMTLDATIATQGTIGGARTSLVPSPGLNVASFFKRTTPKGELTCIGEGVWNIEHHPVIYILKDAYWGDKPSFNSVEKVESEGRTAYQMTIDPDRFGLRLISFLDPTSIGNIMVNPNILPLETDKMTVSVSYGVFNWTTPGYTDGFRNAIGLDYDNPKLSEKSSFSSEDRDAGFKVIRKNHADAMFLGHIDDADKEYVGHRLSQQNLSNKIHRRMFGTSMFYMTKDAGTDDLDEVAMVSDPEVYLPVNSNDRLLYSPEAPDYVVSAVFVAKGMGDEKELMYNSLRFIPEIRYISINELIDVYLQIVDRSRSYIYDNEITYANLQESLSKIKNILDNVN